MPSVVCSHCDTDISDANRIRVGRLEFCSSACLLKDFPDVEATKEQYDYHLNAEGDVLVDLVI